MAFAATTEWDVRTTGSDSNGGGFNTSSTGTDFSQRDTPQISYTDLVIGGTNTNLTSAANPFTAAHVGNIINITGGTGFTVQRVQINSVAGSTATCDKACGTAASTGGTGNLGGGLATLTTAFPLRVARNIVWLKTGTYTLTAALNTTIPYGLIGYGAAHGDNGTPPLVTTATNSVHLFTFGIGAGSDWYFFRNLSLSNTASTKADGMNDANSQSGPPSLTVLECTFTGFANAINNATGAWNLLVSNSTFASNAVAIKVGSSGGQFVITGSLLTGSSGNQIDVSVASMLTLRLIRTQIVAGSTAGIAMGVGGGNVALVVNECTIAGHTTDGILFPSSSSNFIYPVLCVENSILYGNLGYGINFSQPAPAKVAYPYTRNNAYGANTAGALHNLSAGPGDITLTANPFTNSAAGDYSLNSAAGGGAACKAAGYPGVFPGGTQNNFPDLGAVQSKVGAAAGASNYGYTA